MKIEIGSCYCIDCLEGMKYMKQQGLKVDLIIADPPYLINYKSSYRKDKDHKFCKPILNDDNPQIIVDIMPLLYDVLNDDGPLYMFCGSDKVDFFKQQVERYFKIKNIIVWDKGNWTGGDLEAQYGKQYEFIIYANKGRAKFVYGAKRHSDLWRFARISGNEQIHDNQKPLDLYYRIIKQHTQQGEIILDPFAGSQSLRIACHKMQRNYIGFELDKDYYEKGCEWYNKVASQISIFDIK